MVVCFSNLIINVLLALVLIISMNPLRHPFDHREWFETWLKTDRDNWHAGFRPFIFRDFDTVGFFVLLFLGQTKMLAKKFVDVGSTKASQEEIVEYLKACAQPMKLTTTPVPSNE